MKFAIIGGIVIVIAAIIVTGNYASQNQTSDSIELEIPVERITSSPSPTTSFQSKQTSVKSCDPSYPDVCIPPWPPDLDCGEISYKKFRVIGEDKHGFDADKDGIGCER